jgi:hypothetical protein
VKRPAPRLLPHHSIATAGQRAAFGKSVPRQVVRQGLPRSRPLTRMLCRVLCARDMRGIVGKTLQQSATFRVDEIMWIIQTLGIGR